MNKFIVKCWDGDIYIIEGEYKSPGELDSALSKFDKVEMPNGDIIKSSSIEKVTSYSSYEFQTDQKTRHRKGQYIKNGNWFDIAGSLGKSAMLEKITGKINLIDSPKTKKLKN